MPIKEQKIDKYKDWCQTRDPSIIFPAPKKCITIIEFYFRTNRAFFYLSSPFFVFASTASDVAIFCRIF